jgi:hypothetical protein
MSGAAKESGAAKLNRSAANWKLVRQQTWTQISQHKATFCIGFCANCLVVMIVLLLSSALVQFPVIYLKAAELRAGEVDLVKRARLSPGQAAHRASNVRAADSVVVGDRRADAQLHAVCAAPRVDQRLAPLLSLAAHLLRRAVVGCERMCQVRRAFSVAPFPRFGEAHPLTRTHRAAI